MRVLVFLPTYNERGNIERMLHDVRDVLPDAGILVIDDSSPDGTAEAAEKIAAETDNIEVLRRPEKTGLGTAYRDGIRWALDRGYEVFVQMDSDFSHDPRALPSLLAPLENGAEAVIGSRYVPGGSIPDWSLSRRLLSRFGNLYAKAVLGLRVEDSTTGYRTYSTSLLSRLDFNQVRADSYGFNIEMVYFASLAGAEVVEVPIHFVDRVIGKSKLTVYTVVEALALVSWLGIRRLVKVPIRPGGMKLTDHREH